MVEILTLFGTLAKKERYSAVACGLLSTELSQIVHFFIYKLVTSHVNTCHFEGIATLR